MSRKAMIIMALMLAAATAATAATAFAGEKDHRQDIVKSVVQGVNTSSDAQRLAKVKTLRIVRSVSVNALKIAR